MPGHKKIAVFIKRAHSAKERDCALLLSGENAAAYGKGILRRCLARNLQPYGFYPPVLIRLAPVYGRKRRIDHEQVFRTEIDGKRFSCA